MLKLTNVKLLPTTNPNYQVKESVGELIKLCKEKTIYIINNNETIIGVTGVKNKFYEDEKANFYAIFIDFHSFNCKLSMDIFKITTNWRVPKYI